MLIARCPNCGTAFRVVPAQLKVRQGRVRCGHCMTSFDALASLAEEADVSPDVEVPTLAEDVDLAVPVSSPEPAEAPDQPDAPLDAEERPDDRLEPTMGLDESDPESPPPAAAAAAAATPNAAEEPVPTPSSAVQPLEFSLQENSSVTRSWPWLAGCLLAFLALTMQGAVHFRATLAAHLPNTRPLLAALCEPFGCALERPRRIDLIDIESSDLTPDKQTPGHLRLVATLRNKAPFAQEWPHLELTLTDVSDRALLRRALTPAEYLSSPVLVNDGFFAGGDHVVQLDLQTVETPAVGYRLYLFYP